MLIKLLHLLQVRMEDPCPTSISAHKGDGCARQNSGTRCSHDILGEQDALDLCGVQQCNCIWLSDLHSLSQPTAFHVRGRFLQSDVLGLEANTGHKLELIRIKHDRLS